MVSLNQSGTKIEAKSLGIDNEINDREDAEIAFRKTFEAAVPALFAQVGLVLGKDHTAFRPDKVNVAFDPLGVAEGFVTFVGETRIVIKASRTPMIAMNAS
jgi:hypothetical protein